MSNFIYLCIITSHKLNQSNADIVHQVRKQHAHYFSKVYGVSKICQRVGWQDGAGILTCWGVGDLFCLFFYCGIYCALSLTARFEVYHKT